MKKNLLLTVAILMISGGVSAQTWSVGPKVGVNFANVNGFKNSKQKSGLTAGVFLESALCNWFRIQTELMWSEQGFEQKVNDKHYKTNLSYINMPIVAKYYMLGGLNLQTGAQFGYLVTAKEKGADTYGLKDKMNKFNTDLIVGLAYDFNFGLIIEGRYNIGLAPLVSESRDIRNATLQLAAGYRF